MEIAGKQQISMSPSNIMIRNSLCLLIDCDRVQKHLLRGEIATPERESDYCLPCPPNHNQLL